MTPFDYANLLAPIAKVISVMIVIWAIRSSAKASHRQSQLDTFMTYAQ